MSRHSEMSQEELLQEVDLLMGVVYAARNLGPIVLDPTRGVCGTAELPGCPELKTALDLWASVQTGHADA